MATIDSLRIRPEGASVAHYAALVYGIAAIGLAVSALAAASLYSSPNFYGLLLDETAPTALGWVAMLLPPAIALAFDRRATRLGLVTAWALFLTFSAATGIAVAVILGFFAISSVDIAFLICAFSYLCLALIGWRARCDLSATAKFVLAALVGLSAAILANTYLRSGLLDLLFAIAGVLIFAALAAADTDRTRRIFAQANDSSAKRAITGALTLYFDLIHLPLATFGGRLGSRRTRR